MFVNKVFSTLYDTCSNMRTLWTEINIFKGMVFIPSNIVLLFAYLDDYLLGVVNDPLKNEKSQQILPKSRNIAQPPKGSRSLRFCICQSHICFSIKSLHFFVLGSDFKMPVSASRWVLDLPFTTTFIVWTSIQLLENWLEFYFLITCTMQIHRCPCMIWDMRLLQYQLCYCHSIHVCMNHIFLLTLTVTVNSFTLHKNNCLSYQYFKVNFI